MTTEAKLKKLEEDQIIMEDQNCKLAKVGLGGVEGRARITCRAAPGLHGPGLLLAAWAVLKGIGVWRLGSGKGSRSSDPK